MSVSRREFLATTTAAMVSAALPSNAQTPPSVAAPPRSSAASKKLRILVLGGTRFVGPEIIQTALDHGHEVTLFNRGKTNPQFFPKVEKLKGDRFPDRAPGLQALQGKRQWDLVVDTWPLVPGVVKASAELLRDRAARYSYVSTLSVYGEFTKPGISEQDPAVPIPAGADPLSDKLGYAVDKRWAERFVEEAFADRWCVFRPGIISGRDDGANPRSQRVYWPLRVARGGEVLAPGDPASPMQYIDVGDLGRFVIHAAEQDLKGTFNVIGPAGSFTTADYLYGIKAVTTAGATLTWVDESFLLEQKLQPFTDVPLWVPQNDKQPSMIYRVSNARAVKNGLEFRPFAETARNVIESFRGKDVAPNAVHGLSAERERELLEKAKASGKVRKCPV